MRVRSTITRSGSTVADLSVIYTFIVGPGSATNGSDYTSLSGSVTIPAGQLSATVTVTPLVDAVEGDETVTLVLVDRPPYLLGAQTTAVVTIADAPAPVVTITATDDTATEAGLTTGTFTFTRTGSTAVSLTVNYTISGTATHLQDYQQVFSPVVIPVGQASVTRTLIPIQDSLMESPETVTFTLTDHANYDLGSQFVATVTITSDE